MWMAGEDTGTHTHTTHLGLDLPASFRVVRHLLCFYHEVVIKAENAWWRTSILHLPVLTWEAKGERWVSVVHRRDCEGIDRVWHRGRDECNIFLFFSNSLFSSLHNPLTPLGST